MKKKETNKTLNIDNTDCKETPIATFVIEGYKEDIEHLKTTNNALSDCVDKLNTTITELNKTNKELVKTNRKQTVLIIILVIFSILLSAYGIMYWDATHPTHGIITHNSKWNMLKIAFTKKELEMLLDVVHFTPMQKRIIGYRMDEESRVKMADLEKVSVATIDREIKEIAAKRNKWIGR